MLGLGLEVTTPRKPLLVAVGEATSKLLLEDGLSRLLLEDGTSFLMLEAGQ